MEIVDLHLVLILDLSMAICLPSNVRKLEVQASMLDGGHPRQELHSSSLFNQKADVLDTPKRSPNILLLHYM